MRGSYDPERHHRRSIRLRGYDYTQAGAYFITICTFGSECLLGEIREGVVCLNPVGSIVAACWAAIPRHFPHVRLDALAIMPNHLHAVPFLESGEATPVPERENAPRPRGTDAGSVGAIIQNVKAVTTRRANEHKGTAGWHLWQRGYYEHIIRNEAALHRIREYIASNPARWNEDPENPANIERRV